MPFQSEKQRRYLWANEPEIARDWTDTYGSRVQKNNGGIMDIASDGEVIDRFKNYKKGNQVTVPTSFQARSHSTPVKLAYITDDEAGILQSLKSGVPHDGPMHIPNYNDYDPDRGFTSGAAMSAAETGSRNTRDIREVQAHMGPKGLPPGVMPEQAREYRDAAIAAGAGQTVNPGFFGPRHRPEISKQDLRSAKAFAPEAYRATRGSPFGIGNLFRGAMSMFGGIPGSIMSMLSHIDPRQLRGKNLDGSWRTQAQYEQARAERQLRNRINRLRKTRDIGKYADDPEGWAASDLSGRLSDFENQLGITGIATDINYPGEEPVAQISDASLPYRHELEEVPPKNWNFDSTLFDPSQGGITEIDTETTEEMNDPFSAKFATHPATGESVHDKLPGRPLEWLYGLRDDIGFPQNFIRDYNKRNEPYPFINYHPDDQEIYKKRFP